MIGSAWKWAGATLALAAIAAVGLWGYRLWTRPAPTTMGWQAHLRAVAGEWDDPFGLAIDAKGTLFVSDGGERNRIQKVSPEGVVTQIAGSVEGFRDGVASDAAFDTPSALALDAHGNVFVADTGNHAIRKITPEGVVTTLAGNGQPGFRDGAGSEAQFNGPIGIAVDAQGKVWVADTYNDRIRVITPDGQVKTAAGSSSPGFSDGPALNARFDTPCAVALDPVGNLFISDTRNDAIRKLSTEGEVSTVLRGDVQDAQAPLKRPVGLVRTHDGFLYVSEGTRGRIIQIAPSGASRALPDASATPTTSSSVELFRPAGLALAPDGAVYVADQAQHRVYLLIPTANANVSQVTTVSPAVAKPSQMLWPVAPQDRWHEVVGTMGEVRGNYEGESRDHFHAGLDVRAEVGDTVRASVAGKVLRPVANGAFGKLNEGLHIGPVSYIHMQVGRSQRGVSLDPGRFALVRDETDKLAAVRVRRGTRFAAGDALGTVNRMAHVHLEFSPNGLQENPLALPLPGQKDHIAPQISSVRLFDAQGQELRARRGQVQVSRTAGDLAIVVDAFDQMDGNQARRKLGVYALGYQILHVDGTPMPGFEKPLMNITFNRLPEDSEAVKLAYWQGSGITIHGSESTRFLYVVTNRVRDGIAEYGKWNPATLAPGDYTLRVVASDFDGNQASRALALLLE